MQKLWIILLVMGITSCHKELIAPDDADRMQVVKNYVRKKVDAQTLQLLDWNNAESIESGEMVVGYKIPLASSTPNQYHFVLVDVAADKMKGIFRNDIEYSSRPEGLFPEKIANYNYQTQELKIYNTCELVTPNLPGIQLGESLVNAAAKFKVPAVTTIGIYNTESTADVPSSIKEIRTYVLAYLLGLDVGGFRGKILNTVPNGIHFYNPLYNSEKDRNVQVIEWEIGQ